MAARTIDLGKVVGPAGPNSISASTATDLSGVLAGNGATVEVKPVDATPTANSSNLVTSGGVAAKASSLAAGMAIIATGNTHAAITKGQYVYIQGHATLAEGMYEATANIAANGTLSTSNVTAVSGGGLNDLRKAVKYPLSIGTYGANYITNISNCRAYKVGGIAVVTISCQIAATPTGWGSSLITGFPPPTTTWSGLGITRTGIVLPLSIGTSGILEKGTSEGTADGYYIGQFAYPTAD